jgi:tetratricopeptide (TPR) repeat protein
MNLRRSLLLALLALPVSGAIVMPATAQEAKPGEAATTLTGPRNPPLFNGAQALQAGNTAEGVKLTLEGLALADGPREEQSALANLCSGYLRLRDFTSALEYCNRLLERDENAWRAYNTRALVYLELGQYEKADADLTRAEAINPNAQTVKIARGMYNDVVHPVAPEVEIDDRRPGERSGDVAR